MKGSFQLLDIVRNRWLQHFLFWMLSFYVLAKLFAYRDEILLIDWIYTLLFHLSIWPAVYGNLLFLIPKYLQTSKYITYSCLLTILIIGAVSFNFFIFQYLSNFLFPGYYFIAYYGFWDILQFMAAYVMISSLLKLSRGWFQYLEAQRRNVQLAKQKLDAELSALKSQVNPHFLFNSLNNLYSLALDQDPRTPGLILRMSEMMRYLLYESNGILVPLAKEIEHLQNYMEMQRLRVGTHVNISFEIDGKVEDKEVSPLLFLPLVENGFKHGVKGDTKGAFIKVQMNILAERLILQVENNKGQAEELESKTSNGVGLSNLRRRLDLLYPGRHRLEITNGKVVYNVRLKLDFA